MLIKIVEQKLAQAFQKAFPALDLTQYPIVITHSTAANFGHYQCNSAMRLTKVLGLPPREIAQQIVQVLTENAAEGEFEKCEVAGPGFINIHLSAAFLSNLAQKMCNLLASPQHKPFEMTQVPQRIVIDFSSPNTAKEMHVGHLRSTIIGDALAKLLEYLGHDVLRLNHIGDWGTAFGMLIAYIKQYDPALLSQEQDAELTLLVSHYKTAKKYFDENPDFKKQSQLAVVALQQGEPQALAIWQKICDISSRAYQKIYDILDVHLVLRGESFYNPFLAQIIQDIEQKNLMTLSDGAKCMFLAGFENREGEPLPFILQKSDGGYNYATTDMAAILHRCKEEKAQRIIYVTDAGQATHFKMLFAAATQAGYLDPQKVRTDHVPFGLVLGQDGKKFKTRSGENVKLIDLLTSAVEKADEILTERNQHQAYGFDQTEIDNIAQVLGINAVKYADLSCNRISDYTFSFEKMLKFEGNTAAFLMYAYVRIHGIKRKIQNAESASIVLEHPSEIALGVHLCQFEEILDSIAQDLMPNRLCEYLYNLSEKFNAFFRDCRVEGVPEQNQRLALCTLTENILKQGLTILGLKTVNRM